MSWWRRRKLRDELRIAEAMTEVLRGRLARALEQARNLLDWGYIDSDGDDEDCCHDDTCECESIVRINLMLAELEGRTVLATKLRAQLEGPEDS